MKKILLATATRTAPGIWFLSVMLIFIAFSCMEYDAYAPEKATESVLKTNSTSVVLNQRSASADVLEFSWNAASNRGTNAAIGYSLQIDKEGNSFASPEVFDLGKAIYSKKFSTKEMNDLMLAMGFIPEEAGTIEIRLISTVAGESIEPYLSNIASVVIKAYQPVSETLYIIGDASPNGWDAGNAVELIADPEDPTTFTYEGQLNTGEFKFITTQGQFSPSYNRGATAESLAFRTEDSQPDDKFLVTEAGVYRITLNLVDLTIQTEKLSDPVAPPYSELWIVGDATPNGWNIDNPNQMVQDEGDPFIFTYYENLTAGEFKIPTATGNWGADFYMPLVNEQDLSLTGVQRISGGSPDNKWRITTPGAYKIILNLRELTISIIPFTPYAQLWMVGDATPIGWDINSPQPMVQDANDPNIFTYTGELKAGEFKIPVETGDFGGDYFMPVINHPEIQTNTTMRMKFIPNGNPDNKWMITQAGNYKVVVNQLYETIRFEPQ